MASKAVLQEMTPADLQAEAAHWDWKTSCVVKTVSPKQHCCSCDKGGGAAGPTEDELKAVLESVLAQSEALQPWENRSCAACLIPTPVAAVCDCHRWLPKSPRPQSPR